MDLVTFSPRFPEAGETVVGSRFLTYPGGKGANKAVAAARLALSGAEGMGARVRMIGRVGSDAFGRQLLESLEGNGVDVSGVGVDCESSSGVAVINVDASAQNRIVQVLGANAACGQPEFEQARIALEDASILMLQLEVPVELSLAIAREAAAKGKIVVLDPAPAQDIPQELYSLVDYITPNETEAQALVGFPVQDVASARRAAKELLGRGVGCAIIKMGGMGVYYATGEVSECLPAYPVVAVDTVAAGDAFNGALAVALAEGKNLDETMRWAMAAGALAVTKTGAQDSMPTRDELGEFLASQEPR